MANAPYVTLLRYTSGLTDLLQNCLSISSKLLEKGLVTKEIYDSILTNISGESRWQRAARLVSCVTDRVKHTAQAFEIFLSLLNEEPYFSNIVEEMICTVSQLSSVPQQVEITMLKEQHSSLIRQLQSELNANSAVSPEMLVDSLTLFPASLRADYQMFISMNLGALNRAEGIGAIFQHLRLQFTFLNYQLLEHLISQYGSPGLKAEMSIYLENVQVFMRETTIPQIVTYEWPDRHDIPPHFAILSMIVSIGSTNSVLEQLDSIKQRFCSETVLSTYCLSLIEVRTTGSSSILARWVFPSIFLSELLSVIGSLSILATQNGWKAFKNNDEDNDKGGVGGLPGKHGSNATKNEVTKPKQDQSKQVKKSYQMLQSMISLFENRLLPGWKEKKLHQRKRARNIQLQRC